MIHHFWSKKEKILKNNKIIKLLFQLVFSTYIPMVLLTFRVGVTIGCKNLIPHPRSTHVAYFWWTLLYEKWEIHKKALLQSRFSCIYPFSCSRAYLKYSIWVLFGCGIKFCIQQMFLLEIWVNPKWDKLKLRFEKEIVFLFSL